MSKKREHKPPPKLKRRSAAKSSAVARVGKARGGAVREVPRLKAVAAPVKLRLERSSAAVRRSKPPSKLGAREKLRIYRMMVRVRAMEERMLSLQRQGRIGFYGSSYGQEAATLASAAALAPDDWIFPGLREASAMLLRGYPLIPWLAQLFGNQGDPAKGRQMPSHQGDRGVRQASWSSVIGTQLPQAVGAAYAAKLRGEKTVVAACFGDGATSSAAFSQALLVAKRLAAPVVFCCQNNHWSDLRPALAPDRRDATLQRKAKRSESSPRRVDGNSVDAVYEATAAAVAEPRRSGSRCCSSSRPTGSGAHSSSDDPTSLSRSEGSGRPGYSRSRSRAPNAATDRRRSVDRSEGPGPSERSSRENRRAHRCRPGLSVASPESLFEDVYDQAPWLLAEQRGQLLDELAAAPRQRP